MNSEKVQMQVFSRRSKSIYSYRGSNPLVKKVRYLFYLSIVKKLVFANEFFIFVAVLLTIADFYIQSLAGNRDPLPRK